MVYSIIHLIRQQRMEIKNQQLGIYYDKINMIENFNIQDEDELGQRNCLIQKIWWSPPWLWRKRTLNRASWRRCSRTSSFLAYYFKAEQRGHSKSHTQGQKTFHWHHQLYCHVHCRQISLFGRISVLSPSLASSQLSKTSNVIKILINK